MRQFISNQNKKSMKKTMKDMLNGFLILLLLIAPIELLFASVNMTHETSEDPISRTASYVLQHDDIFPSDLDAHTAFADVKAATTVDDCDSKCPHCVFCSAALASVLSVNTMQFLSIYNPLVNVLSSELYPDLYIEPPISL